MSGKGFEDWGRESGQLLNANLEINFQEIAEYLPNELLPLLLQRDAQFTGLTADQQFFNENGFIVKKNFIPHDLIDEYVRLRRRLNLGRDVFPDYWSHLDYRVFRDLFCSKEMNNLLLEVMGEPMGLHLLLTHFRSLERGWHQDDYLNPHYLSGRYVGVWMAMDDVPESSGPFECIPGSHRWPILRRELVKQLVVEHARDDNTMEWAIVAEYHVNKAVERMIEQTRSSIFKFLGNKGDVLIWSGLTMHRGSLPQDPDIVRPSLIGHMSSLARRMDFDRNITRHEGGGYFWEFPQHRRTLSPVDTDRMFANR